MAEDSFFEMLGGSVKTEFENKINFSFKKAILSESRGDQIGRPLFLCKNINEVYCSRPA